MSYKINATIKISFSIYQGYLRLGLVKRIQEIKISRGNQNQNVQPFRLSINPKSVEIAEKKMKKSELPLIDQADRLAMPRRPSFTFQKVKLQFSPCINTKSRQLGNKYKYQRFLSLGIKILQQESICKYYIYDQFQLKRWFILCYIFVQEI
ncbi:unnamed protein product [Paramecium pentaurelia]|uniref:Uncharacterized protein n=1 Tax=Paramecium pentaurelia TaxID=43138 RepID=A0A8S1TE06_9CILI|nr:unnamed protein product [Paramecium pentaurelia]